MKAKFLSTTWRTAPFRYLFCLLLAACLCLALLPVLPAVPASAEAYYDEAMDRLVSWGILDGYEDGSLRPDNPITRAEFAAMVNRAYGFSETGPTPFTDVPATAWYADDIAIAYNAGFFEGDDAGVASPDAYLTRESAMTLLARNMRLESIPGEVTEFTDGRNFSYWSRGYVKAAVRAGLIDGYEDGTFRPQNYISRGEMAAILARALGTLVNAPGVTTLGNVYGNVTLNQPGSTLQDTVIAGDLIISGGVGLESVTLDNVRVLGNIIVAGGGESNAGETIVLRNVTADQLIVDSLGNKYIALRAEGDTVIDLASLRSNAYVMDHTQSGFGLLNISVDGGNLFTLAGNLENIVNRVANSELRIGSGSVQNLTVAEIASGARLIVDSGAAVRNLNLDTGTAVSGKGDVGTLNVNTAGSSTEMLPDDINIRPGLVSSVAGTEMDSTMAQESSAEPRLLAGYPQANNLAPTSATAAFKTNKAGTVYWAVSTIADGSIGENDLINPPAYATKIVKSGNLNAAASNTEYKTNITGLAKGGSYYLSAILVDSRGARSPVKVVSFTTPDDTAPNFTGSTPKLTLNKYDKTSGIYVAQVQVISNKTCQLYWALYASGASAPTATEFRTGNLGGALAHNVMEVTRNAETYVDLNNYYTLQEKTEYIVYLWLNDADNGKSSAVRNIRFTTVDGTPPVVTLNTNGTPTATSIPLRGSINEPGTIYVLAIAADSGITFPDPTLSDEAIAIQIEKNSNSGTARRTASARVNTANVEVSFNLTGLKGETSYDIWYIAKDTAGNYSARHMLTASTLDTHAPTVTQNFLNYDPTTGRPYADTTIELIFNENIQFYNSATTYKDIFGLRPLDLYNTITDDSLPPSEREAARKQLTEILWASIKFYSYPNGIETEMKSTDSPLYIDYSKAEVRMEEGKLRIIFPWTDDPETNAVNLSSGATYKFKILSNCIADTSDNHNLMPETGTGLDEFTTISAQVVLEKYNISSIPLTGNSEQVDFAFTIHPTSSNVSEDTDFDILFWFDTTVSFKLYRRDAKTGLWSAVETVADREADREQRDLPVEVPSAKPGFYGASLYGETGFEGRTEFPAVVEELKEGSYAIQLTSVGHETERDKWNATVKFEVSVVTGDTNGLGSLAAVVTRDQLAYAKENLDVDEIHTPYPFQMEHTYTNSTAPVFRDNYPMFTGDGLLDSTATLDLMLTREGTIYWVVAPVQRIMNDDGVTVKEYIPAIGTTLENNEELTVTNVNEKIPTIGNNPNNARCYLSSPLPYEIYDPTFASNGDIQTGTVNVSRSASVKLQLDNLTPDTMYFMYVVMQGTGQVYSKQVEIYKFTTMRVNRPRLYLTNSGTGASSSSTLSVTSRNMNSTGTYAMFMMANLPTELSEPFYTEAVMGKDNKTQFDIDYKGNTKHKQNDPTKENCYTVYDAMAEQDNRTGGSLYDQYASPEHKDAVLTLLTASGNSLGRLGTVKNVNLPYDAAQIVDCPELFPEMVPNRDYLFVVCARNINANDSIEADSYGYSAFEPVYLSDYSYPVIQEISPVNLTVTFDSSGKFTISGIIQMAFNKLLYYYDNVTGLNEQIVGGEKGNLANFVDDLTKDQWKISASGISNTASYSTVNFTLGDETKKVTEGDGYRANRTVGGFYAAPNLPLAFELSFDPTAYNGYGGVVVTILNTDPWYPAGSVTLRCTVNYPPPTGLTVTPTSATIRVGETIDFKAQFIPANASGTVRWFVDSSNVSLSSTTGMSITATGRTVGKVKITVTVDGLTDYKQEIEIEVIQPAVSLDPSTLENMKVNDQQTLKITVSPENINYSVYQWYSSNTNVATVSAQTGPNSSGGNVKAVGKGTAEITVRVQIGDTYYTSSPCTVTVTE